MKEFSKKCFIYYPAIMPQNSSQGTKSQNFLGGLIAPPKPPAAYGSLRSPLPPATSVRLIRFYILGPPLHELLDPPMH